MTGIGGVFFRARDPELLNSWYEQHLGVPPAPATYDEPSWWQQPGPTVFAAMPADSNHFGSSAHSWAVNVRVVDLDAMGAQLRGAGVHIELDAELYPNGRFANLLDPDGNSVQLWQPAGVDARGPA